MTDLLIIRIVAGAVIGIISGALIGSFNVYSKMNKANNLGSQWNPEYKEKPVGKSGQILAIIVGAIFAIIGVIIALYGFSISSEIAEGPMLIVFGFVSLGFGLLALYAGISSGGK